MDPHVCGCLDAHRVLQTLHAWLREGKRLPSVTQQGPVGACSPAVSASEASVCSKLEAGGGSRAGGGQLGGGQGPRSPRGGGRPRSLPPCTGRACGLVRSLPGGAGTCRWCQGVKLSVTVCPVSLAPCALGERGCSAPTGPSSRGQTADGQALVPSVGVGREAPGCSGKQADWGASLEL